MNSPEESSICPSSGYDLLAPEHWPELLRKIELCEQSRTAKFFCPAKTLRHISVICWLIVCCLGLFGVAELAAF